jgi:hypothetical protein
LIAEALMARINGAVLGTLKPLIATRLLGSVRRKQLTPWSWEAPRDVELIAQ